MDTPIYTVGPTVIHDFEYDQSYSRMIQLGMSTETAKVLHSPLNRWIPPEEWFWTPDSFFKVRKEMTDEYLAEARKCTGGCFYDLSLESQCELLGIKIELLLAGYTKDNSGSAKHWTAYQTEEKLTIEDLVLTNKIGESGWKGTNDEGKIYCFIHSSLMYYFRPIWQEKNGPAWSESAFHLGLRKEFISDLIEFTKTLFETTTKSHEFLLKMHKTLIKEGLIRGSDKFSIAAALEAFDGWIKMNFVEILKTSHIYGNALSGWPDLTLWNDSSLRFIEVKGTDKLHRNQAYWIRNIAKPLGYDYRVVKVVKKMRKR